MPQGYIELDAEVIYGKANSFLIAEAGEAQRTDVPSHLFQTRFLPLFCISPVFWDKVAVENLGTLIMVFD